MKRILQHPFTHLTVGIISFLLLYFSVSFLKNSSPDYTAFNTSLNQKENLAEQVLNELITNETTVSFTKKYTQLNKQKGISFYIIENDKLNYWSNRSIYFSPNLDDFPSKNGLVKLKNGWYQYLLKKGNQKTYLALILIFLYY